MFHIRISVSREQPVPLTDQNLAPLILDSVIYYARNKIWWPRLFLLMPDHLHALLSFPPDRTVTRTIGDWKRWLTKTHAIQWQENFFDHHIRDDESLDEKATYIRRNPVVKGLCDQPEDWPWMLSEEQVRQKLADSR